MRINSNSFRLSSALLLLLQSWCSLVVAQEVELDAEEQAYLHDNPVLRIQRGNWAPFNYSEYGEMKGFSNSYIRLIAEKIGAKIEFVGPLSFNTYLSMLKSHQLDLITNLNRTPERMRSILYSERSTVEIHDALLFRENHLSYQKLDDLRGKTVAVVKGYFHEELIRKYHPQITLLLTASPLELIRSVVNGDADAAIESLPVFNYYTNKYFFTGLKIQPLFGSKLFPISKQYIGIRNDRPILKRIIDKAMASVTEQELSKLRRQWGTDGNSSRPSSQKELELELNPKEREYLQQKGSLSFCASPDRMPVESVTNGQHHGISMDLGQFIEQQTQHPFVIHPATSWTEALEQAKRRECDLIALTDQSETLSQHMNFSRPLLESPLVLATHSRRPYVDDLALLDKSRIGVLKGHTAEEVLRNGHPLIEVVGVDTIEQGLEQVSLEVLDGFVGPLLTVGYAIAQGQMNLKINRKLEHKIQLGIASRNDEPLLTSIIEKSLDTLSTKRQQQMIANWGSVRYQQEVDYTSVLIVILVGGLFFSVLLYRHYLLKRHQSELSKSMDTQNTVMKEQNNFIAMLSHEVSNPLASINASIDLIGLYIDDKPKEIETELHRIGRTADRLSNLVDGMLLNDWIDATSGEEWSSDQVDLQLILQQLSEEYPCRLKLNSKRTITIEANTTLITTALSNILNNANKFTRSGTEVLVDVSIVGNGTVVIDIQDNGPGIPAEDQPHIFEKFYRSSHGKEKTGSGLGLYITRKIVQFHGGTVTIHHSSPTGTTFRITLPIIKAAEEP